MVKMRGRRVGVERLGKSTSKNTYLSMPEDTSSTGRIKYLGEELQGSGLVVGMKVVYGKDRQQVAIEGADILVMEDSNILAIISEEASAQGTQSS